jgi:hypothetical protein
VDDDDDFLHGVSDSRCDGKTHIVQILRLCPNVDDLEIPFFQRVAPPLIKEREDGHLKAARDLHLSEAYNYSSRSCYAYEVDDFDSQLYKLTFAFRGTLEKLYGACGTAQQQLKKCTGLCERDKADSRFLYTAESQQHIGILCAEVSFIV